MSVSNDGNHNNTDRLLHAFLLVQTLTVGKTPNELLTSQTNFAHDLSITNQRSVTQDSASCLRVEFLLLEDGQTHGRTLVYVSWLICSIELCEPHILFCSVPFNLCVVSLNNNNYYIYYGARSLATYIRKNQFYVQNFMYAIYQINKR